MYLNSAMRTLFADGAASFLQVVCCFMLCPDRKQRYERERSDGLEGCKCNAEFIACPNVMLHLRVTFLDGCRPRLGGRSRIYY